MDSTEDRPGGDRATWWSAVAALVILTVITAVISYEHAYAVFRAARNTGLLAVLGPVVPDLVIAVASVSLLAASGAGLPRPWLATATLTVFVAVTVALNVAAGLRYGRGSALLAVLAPAGYLAGLHILASMMRRGRGGPVSAPAPAAPGRCPHGEARTAEQVAVLAHEHARDCLGQALSQRQLAAVTVPSRARVAGLVSPASGQAPGAGAVNGNGSHPAGGG